MYLMYFPCYWYFVLSPGLDSGYDKTKYLRPYKCIKYIVHQTGRILTNNRLIIMKIFINNTYNRSIFGVLMYLDEHIKGLPVSFAMDVFYLMPFWCTLVYLPLMKYTEVHPLNCA